MSDRGELPPEQWQRVKEVFGAALERAPEERSAFIDQTCGPGETAVRREVEALLAAHRTSDSFLNTPAAAMAGGLAEGQILGPYRVLRTLGRGGMATVYLARDERHKRSVALKVLHPDLAHALGPARFLREIEVAANLSHPHILPLHDSGEVEGLLYYVMPYVEGESLRDRLKRETQLPVDDALQLAREVADALAYAHGQGVIHRDIKPENILLSGGHALVADFGIARALSQTGDAPLTETGMAIGTAAYMSPEQACGDRQLDGRSDVYSLGCVLYEMLAGEPPHSGPSVQAILARAMTEAPRPIHTIRPGVSRALDAAIAKAMAVTRADRYATAAEFARTLDAAQHPPAASQPEADFASRRLRPWRGHGLMLGALAVGVLAGAAAIYVWRESNANVGDARVKHVAVLPFENLGDTAAGYLVDGITDAVRGKLAALPGLRVTARSSSIHYGNTTKTPQQIGQELGVQYLLTATVRWERAAAGASRVQVTPELVQTATASTSWQEAIAAPLGDVFDVQGEIGSRVAHALHLALGDDARRRLATRPTSSLTAYDAFLKGEQASQSLAADDPATLRGALAHYERAVALDSSFVQAWAQLSQTHSLLYFNSTPTPTEAEAARRAAVRALALDSRRAEGHVAMGMYFWAVAKDYERAAEAFEAGRKFAPNDADLLTKSVGPDLVLGRWAPALAHLRQAQTLDPRSVTTGSYLVWVLLSLRRYPEARQAADRALMLAPTNLTLIHEKAMVLLAQGDLAGARAVVDAVPSGVDRAAMAAYFALYFGLYWVLTDADQRLVLQSPPSAFDDDRSRWGIVLAQTYWLRGDQVSARLYADSARIAVEEHLGIRPQDAQLHSLHSLCLAYLGRKAEAVREAQRAKELLPIDRNAAEGPYLQDRLARIYLLVGEPEQALDELEPLLKIPYYVSPGWLRIDPDFQSLRGNPRFQRLSAGKP